MQSYYYETKHGKGWHKAETDAQAKRHFRLFGGIKVWRVARDGSKVLILRRKEQRGSQIPH